MSYIYDNTSINEQIELPQYLLRIPSCSQITSPSPLRPDNCVRILQLLRWKCHLSYYSYKHLQLVIQDTEYSVMCELDWLVNKRFKRWDIGSIPADVWIWRICKIVIPFPCWLIRLTVLIFSIIFTAITHTHTHTHIYIYIYIYICIKCKDKWSGYMILQL